MQTITVEFRDGSHTELRQGDDLSSNWDQLMDSSLTNVQHAVWRRPSRDGQRMLVCGSFGEPRADQLAREAELAAHRAELSRAAEEALYAGRDWTYNGYTRSLGTG